MMIGFYDVAVDPSITNKTMYARPKTAAQQ
jgi:hypothetical protein